MDLRNLIPIAALILGATACTSSPIRGDNPREPASERPPAPPSARNSDSSSEIQNKLMPFTTDGCTKFPNGIPFYNSKKWLHCCVAHDVAYWQGGTSEQREIADHDLRHCVAQTGEPEIAEAMYLGVRAGGNANLPTSWRWGYGWAVDRGYAPLTSEEEEQVAQMTPKDLTRMPLIPQSDVPIRSTLTGNYCVDATIKHIQAKLGRSFEIVDQTEQDYDGVDGLWRTFTIRTDGCDDPFKFTFLLLRKNACEVETNELIARGRIRLMKIISPSHCRTR